MTIDPGPLRAAKIEALAGEFVEASQSYVARCIARAQGNPLFLEQLLLNANEGEAGAVPATIQSLILARMDRLEPGDKQALQAAWARPNTWLAIIPLPISPPFRGPGPTTARATASTISPTSNAGSTSSTPARR